MSRIISYCSNSALASAPLRSSPGGPRLWEVGVFFFKVGAFTFGGGLSMLAFMQEQVVSQLGWLTPKEFVDGLALGQMTPGPPLMVAAFVGFKLFGIAGAAVAAAAKFLPSFLTFLPILPRHRDIVAAHARGILRVMQIANKSMRVGIEAIQTAQRGNP